MYVPLFVLVALSTKISYTVIAGHCHVRVIMKGMIQIKVTVKLNTSNIKQKILNQIEVEAKPMQLTRDTDKILCLIYEEFLERRKSGLSKSVAKTFEHPSALQEQFLQGIHEDDIYDALTELSHNGMIRAYYDMGFQLNDSAIIYMENRFKNGLKEVTDFISKFIP